MGAAPFILFLLMTIAGAGDGPFTDAKAVRERLATMADDRLADLPPALTAWAKRFDAKGLAQQQPKP